MVKLELEQSMMRTMWRFCWIPERKKNNMVWWERNDLKTSSCWGETVKEERWDDILWQYKQNGLNSTKAEPATRTNKQRRRNQMQKLTVWEVVVQRLIESILGGRIFQRGEKRLQLFWWVQAWNFTFNLSHRYKQGHEKVLQRFLSFTLHWLCVSWNARWKR